MRKPAAVIAAIFSDCWRRVAGLKCSTARSLAQKSRVQLQPQLPTTNLRNSVIPQRPLKSIGCCAINLQHIRAGPTAAKTFPSCTCRYLVSVLLLGIAYTVRARDLIANRRHSMINPWNRRLLRNNPAMTQSDGVLRKSLRFQRLCVLCLRFASVSKAARAP
jgi:hypothetical protein